MGAVRFRLLVQIRRLNDDAEAVRIGHLGGLDCIAFGVAGHASAETGHRKQDQAAGGERHG